MRRDYFRSVDDVAVNSTDEDRRIVVKSIAKVLLSICSRANADGLEISARQSVVTTSLTQIGEDIAKTTSFQKQDWAQLVSRVVMPLPMGRLNSEL